MLRRATLTTSIVLLAVLAGAGPSAADPGNGQGQATFPMVCDGELETLTIGGGAWAAADLGSSGGKLIPKATHFSIHDDAGSVLHEEHDVKRGYRGGSSCVDEFEMDGLRYEFVVEGKLKGSD
jgi:hypothetical protein